MKQRGACEEGNSQSAKIIVSDRLRHGGDDSLMVRWAEAFLGKREQPELFSEARA